MVGFDSSELIEFMEVDDESVSCHLVDGFIVSYGVVVFCYYARIRSKRYFYFSKDCTLWDLGLQIVDLFIF